MKEFDTLTNTLDRLLAPDGCPWDRVQTMESLRTTVFEEVCELLEAIDEKDDLTIEEELGDLFLNAIFFCKIAEKEERFTLKKVLTAISEKLIRRHPHVFGDKQASNPEEVMTLWEAEKQKEKGHTRKSAIDGIPKTLPTLARAQKLLKRLEKAQYNYPKNKRTKVMSEKELGDSLLSLVQEAKEKGLDAEQALRHTLADLEKEFRSWECS